MNLIVFTVILSGGTFTWYSFRIVWTTTFMDVKPVDMGISVYFLAFHTIERLRFVKHHICVCVCVLYVSVNVLFRLWIKIPDNIMYYMDGPSLQLILYQLYSFMPPHPQQFEYSFSLDMTSEQNCKPFSSFSLSLWLSFCISLSRRVYI